MPENTLYVYNNFYVVSTVTILSQCTTVVWEKTDAKNFHPQCDTTEIEPPKYFYNE